MAKAVRRRSAVLIVALLCAVLPGLTAIPAHAGDTDVVELSVRFEVRNVNRSELPCYANGAHVTIVGTLIAPRSALSDTSRAVTLYLHEFSFGKWMWNFPDAEYDYAARMADKGHVSVVVDRLGYGASDHPHGFETCLGADADIAHQMVTQLRQGSYQVTGATAPSFDRVVLAGHSGGGMSAQITAYSFGDVDGLMLFSHADQGFSFYGMDQGGRQGFRCALGGEPSEPGQPGGYAYFGETDAEWQKNFFHEPESRIVQAATEMRHRDPCGNAASFGTGPLVNPARLGEISIPVLLLYPLDDSLYDHPSAGRNQARLFTGSSDVSLSFFPGGHALPLQPSAPALRDRTSQWLDQHGFR